jgi:peptidoglycan/xylan/chitin deacetylase (PgdA/CDA1 family)
MRTATFVKRQFTSLMQRVRPQGLILLYHRVATVDVDPWQLCVCPEYFEEHLAVLKKFRPTCLAQFPDAMQPGSIVVTFDDGYADNLHCAARLLQQYDIPATFFLTTGYLGGNEEFWWDELERRLALVAQNGARLELTIAGRIRRWDLTAMPGTNCAWLPAYYELYDLLQPLTHADRRGVLRGIGCAEGVGCARQSHRVLTMDEVSELAGLGAGPASAQLIEIGAHTVTHPRLAVHSAKDQLTEMRESRRFLEAAVGRNIRSFSYPFGGRGHYTAESVQMAREAGFSTACTTTQGTVERTSSRFELPRVVIGNIDGNSFEDLLNRYVGNRN